jgi:hypothetical protein
VGLGGGRLAGSGETLRYLNYQIHPDFLARAVRAMKLRSRPIPRFSVGTTLQKIEYDVTIRCSREVKPIVYEMRVYTLQPGKVAAFQADRKGGATGHQQILKASTVVVHRGRTLNEVVHIWAYEDPNHPCCRRTQARDGR